MKFRYQLSKEEMKEVLLCENWKRESLFYSKHIWLMTLLGFWVLYEYKQEPQKFYLFFLLITIIVLLIYMLYAPSFTRGKKLKQMMKINGEYQLEISPDCILFGEENKRLLLNGKKIRAVYTKHMYTIQVGGEMFGLPRRILSQKQEENIKTILEQNNSQMVKLVVSDGIGKGGK